jgi:hypothetical protein
MINSVQHSTRPYDKFVAKKASEYVYTTSFLATQEFMRPNSTPHFGLPIDGPRITSSFVTKRLVAGGFKEHKVAVKRLNIHITADSLDDLVKNLIVAKGSISAGLRGRGVESVCADFEEGSCSSWRGTRILVIMWNFMG